LYQKKGRKGKPFVSLGKKKKQRGWERTSTSVEGLGRIKFRERGKEYR